MNNIKWEKNPHLLSSFLGHCVSNQSQFILYILSWCLISNQIIPTVLSSTIADPPTWVWSIRYQPVLFLYKIRSFRSLEDCFLDTKRVEADKSFIWSTAFSPFFWLESSESIRPSERVSWCCWVRTLPRLHEASQVSDHRNRASITEEPSLLEYMIYLIKFLPINLANLLHEYRSRNETARDIPHIQLRLHTFHSLKQLSPSHSQPPDLLKHC